MTYPQHPLARSRVLAPNAHAGTNAVTNSRVPAGQPYIRDRKHARCASPGECMTAPFEMGKFVGAPVRAQAFDGVSVAENTYAAGLSVAAHTHDAPLLSLVLHGSATE